MTDYFALLAQPRQPWLDPEKLKQAFHQATLRAHPDTRGPEVNRSDAEDSFAQVNEGYQVLRDPRRRLHHLLSLEGQAPSAGSSEIPPEISGVFENVASAIQVANGAITKANAATSSLSRALVRADVLRAGEQVEKTLEMLLSLGNASDAELGKLSKPDGGVSPADLAALHALYLRFSFLLRWIDQLEEWKTRISALS